MTTAKAGLVQSWESRAFAGFPKWRPLALPPLLSQAIDMELNQKWEQPGLKSVPMWVASATGRGLASSAKLQPWIVPLCFMQGQKSVKEKKQVSASSVTQLQAGHGWPGLF